MSGVCVRPDINPDGPNSQRTGRSIRAISGHFPGHRADDDHAQCAAQLEEQHGDQKQPRGDPVGLETEAEGAQVSRQRSASGSASATACWPSVWAGPLRRLASSSVRRFARAASISRAATALHVSRLIGPSSFSQPFAPECL